MIIYKQQDATAAAAAALAAAANVLDTLQDNFLPLLPNLKATDLSDHSDLDHDHDGDHDDQSRSADRTPGYKPPWLPRLARFSSPMLRFHNEIVAFTKMLEPTPEEVDSRAKSMRVIRDVVHSIWPHAEVSRGMVCLGSSLLPSCIVSCCAEND